MKQFSNGVSETPCRLIQQVSGFCRISTGRSGEMSGADEPPERSGDHPRSPSPSPQQPSRVVISDADLSSFTAADLTARWRRQDAYVDVVEQRLARQEGR